MNQRPTPQSLSDDDWTLILDRIEEGTCTPFLGAGASWPYVDLGGDIAARWAMSVRFPLADSRNLARVAQFISLNLGGVLWDPDDAARRMVRYLAGCQHPPYDDPSEPYAILADLPLPIYLTTNYDPFMAEALRHAKREPHLDFSRWNERLQNSKKYPVDRSYEPTPANPLVFHLHGVHKFVESLVLTEDDYIDFVASVSSESNILPPAVTDAIADGVLLFLGYSLADWNVRVLLRTLRRYFGKNTRRLTVAVQLKPSTESGAAEDAERAMRFFERYFENQQIFIFWGTCQDFLRELRGARDKARGLASQGAKRA